MLRCASWFICTCQSDTPPPLYISQQSPASLVYLKMHMTTGATAGLRRGVAAGFGPASMVISLTFGTLPGGPEAAASAGRFASDFPTEAFDKENFDMALADGNGRVRLKC